MKWEAIGLQAVVLAQMGRTGEVEPLLAELRKARTVFRDPGFDRLILYVEGRAALARGQTGPALEALTKAASGLRPRAGFGPPSEHAGIWSAVGEAHLAAGDRTSAAPWFQRIIDSGVERVYQPLQFVRSFYHLGRIAEQSGDTVKAREFYRRFVGYWKDGDIDRDRVAEAQRFLARP